MMHGKGVLDWKDGRIFRGGFHKGKKHHNGSFEFGDGRTKSNVTISLFLSQLLIIVTASL